MMSSMAPTYSIMLMASMMGRTASQSQIHVANKVPQITPKNTAIPPMTGTGRFCSLRALGLSTRFFSLAIARILKYTQNVISMETKDANKRKTMRLTIMR